MDWSSGAWFARCSLGSVCLETGEEWEREERPSSTAAGKPPAPKPRNKGELSLNTQEKITLVFTWWFVHTSGPFRGLSDNAGPSAKTTRGGWKLKRKQNNNSGKKTGITPTVTIKQHSPTSGLPGAGGKRPNLENGKLSVIYFSTWGILNIDFQISFLGEL